MSHPIKCGHDVYWPASDVSNLGCQACNPDGLGAGAVPVLPRSSGDSLGRKEESRESCLNCGNMRTYFSDICRNCSTPFPDDAARGRTQGMANQQQAGSCPDCGSTVHYETAKKSIWECSECGKAYRAPKIAEVSGE